MARSLLLLGLWILLPVHDGQGASLARREILDEVQLSVETPEVGPRYLFSWPRSTDADIDLDTFASVEIASPEALFNQAPTRSFKSIRLDDNQALTITGGPGETVVLNLRNFALYDDATLTLQGTATTTFIINVRHNFSLAGNAKITLAGGLQWDDTLFNVIGTGHAVSLTGDATLEGILTANNRKVRLNGQVDVIGEVFAKKISLAGNAQIIQPPVASP